MKSNELVNLMFSPPWIAKLLHHFLSGAQRNNIKGIKTELLFLSVPLILDDVVRVRLQTSNSKSTLASILVDDESLITKNALIRKNNQVKQYREFVNRGLIFLGNIDKLDISDFTKVNSVAKYQKEPVINRGYCKAAYYLGLILAKEDYKNVFMKLGVTNI